MHFGLDGFTRGMNKNSLEKRAERNDYMEYNEMHTWHVVRRSTNTHANNRFNVMFHSVAKAEIVIQFAEHLTSMYMYFIGQNYNDASISIKW